MIGRILSFLSVVLGRRQMKPGLGKLRICWLVRGSTCRVSEDWWVCKQRAHVELPREVRLERGSVFVYEGIAPIGRSAWRRPGPRQSRFRLENLGFLMTSEV